MNQKTIPFSKFNILGLSLSLLITISLLALTVFLHKGFNFGIDFSSGQSITIEINEESSLDTLETLLAPIEQANITQLGTDNRQYNIKIASTAEEQEARYQELIEILDAEFTDYNVLSSAFIGSAISQNLLNNSVYIVAFALLLMLLYIWLRFKFQFAAAAILALLHDALFIIGFIGALQLEVTISTVAAVLTIIGYSINDTIVIFDRIRENITLMRGNTLRNITDTSITKTLSRTIITSLTTLLAVLSIFIFATGDIKNFALVLIVGVVEGIWSSIFIATPLLYALGFSKKLNRISLPEKHSSLSAVPAVTAANLASPQNSTSGTDAPQKPVSQEYIDKVRMEIQSKKRRKQH